MKKKKNQLRDILKNSQKGMGLEYDINLANHYYLTNEVANIHKKPTPIQVVDITHKTSKPLITKAFFQKPSTTDYNGIYKGKYLDFEAKETKSQAFPLKNIHKHQYEHLQSVVQHGGLAFIIIRFTTYNKTFLLTFEKLWYFLETSSRKSIPLSFFEEKAIIIKDNFHPRLDYIKAIDFAFKEKLYEKFEKCEN